MSSCWGIRCQGVTRGVSVSKGVGCKSVKGCHWYQGMSRVSRYVKVLGCQVSRGEKGVRDVQMCQRVSKGVCRDKGCQGLLKGVKGF